MNPSFFCSGSVSVDASGLVASCSVPWTTGNSLFVPGQVGQVFGVICILLLIWGIFKIAMKMMGF